MDWILDNTTFALTCLIIAYTIGFLHIIHVLIHVQASQSAVAWMLALLIFPVVAVPCYWLTGRTRFEGYIRARRADDKALRAISDSMRSSFHKYSITPKDAFGRAAEMLGGLPFTHKNKLKLLIDGEETFEAIFQEIAKATDYILINYYTVMNDRIGTRFKQAIIERARAGVRVYFLIDGFGSWALSRHYLHDLRAAGVQCYSFGSNRHWWSRLQINFRNHRKILIVDGNLAFMGGINIGDIYLGRDPRFGKWRDTHMCLHGPSVQAIQLVFLEDWYWATGEVPELHWECEEHDSDQETAIIPTGPSDYADSWQLIIAEAANTARERFWITSPYFVPDEGVLTALQTAAMRGVDIRILIPNRPDHHIVWLAAYSYQREILPFGIRLFRYTDGFLHQKVMLIDDRLACISTANLDNRSFRLNFEISALTTDAGFIQEVTEMLEKDFASSREITHNELNDRSFLFRLLVRCARLLSPIL